MIFEEGRHLIRIGAEAFGWSGLANITIPNSVAILGEGCFENCKNLKGVILEEGSQLRDIGKTAFAVCVDLEKVKVPNEDVDRIVRDAWKEFLNPYNGQIILQQTQ